MMFFRNLKVLLQPLNFAAVFLPLNFARRHEEFKSMVLEGVACFMVTTHTSTKVSQLEFYVINFVTTLNK